MSALDLDAIRGRLDGLTGGPWRAVFPDHFENGVVIADDGDMAVAEVHGYSADAEFIAHAREDIPALVTAVVERDEQIAALQAQLDWHAEQARSASEWADPERRLASLNTRALNRIDALVPSDVLDRAKREALAQGWHEGAQWAAAELGAITTEQAQWLAPGENPYRAEAQQ